MRTRLLSVAVGMLALLLVASPASAGRVWCSRDPVIKVNGQVVDALVSSYADMTSSATGPIQFVVTVPSGVSASVIASDNGFGYGYSISVKTSSTLKATATSIPIQVQAYAPAKDRTLPVKVDIKPRSKGLVTAATAQGAANSWVTARTR